MIWLYWLRDLFFPPKCLLCGRILERRETDLCRQCRTTVPEAAFSRIRFPHLDRWTTLWYYEGAVRRSLLRFKFYTHPSSGRRFGALLAMKLVRDQMDSFDVLTWVPVSRTRRLTRGYDQSALIARGVGKALGCKPVRLLRKTRNTPPQSSLSGSAARRANVLGAYQPLRPDRIAGKRILLIDDILTTGATAGECARTLLTAGAAKVDLAAVARRRQDS